MRAFSGTGQPRWPDYSLRDARHFLRNPFGCVGDRHLARFFRHAQQHRTIPVAQRVRYGIRSKLRLLKNFGRARFFQRQRVPVLLAIFVLKRHALR